MNKVEEKSASYESGKPGGKLPLNVSTFDVKVETKAIGDRVRQAREALGLTQPEFVATYGGSKPGIQDNEAGKNMPGGRVLLALRRLGVNVNWILTGEGQMLEGGERRSGVDRRSESLNGDALRAVLYALITAAGDRPDPVFIADAAVDAYERYVVNAAANRPNGSKAA